MDRMHEAMAKHVDRGALPGVVAAVSRGGEVQVTVVGTLAVGGKEPMRRDTLFRISSMSKPITAAATMALVEDGRLTLDAPVDDLLPELARCRVLRREDGPLDDTVPAARAITLRDLLTMRMGFGILWGPPGATPIQRAADELHLGAFGPPKPLEAPPPDEWMRRFASLPLMHQPGERWMYNTSIEVLSVLLARAAGKPLPALLGERIFGPLGMKDTSFSVPASKLDRLATSYMAKDPFRVGEAGAVSALELYDPAAGGQWATPPAFPSGAAGLVSTVDDYLAFGQMMLDRGTLGRTRVLSAASVDAMTTDQLSAGEKAISDVYPPDYWKNHGWGYAMEVVTGPDDYTPVPGRYGWDGGLGTSWRTDPKRGIVGVLMTQLSAFPGAAGVYRDFWTEALRG